ncbi:MAG: MFS transporter [Candidatus Kariarchaeaceae archaeon]|jgi:MFS family permease
METDNLHNRDDVVSFSDVFRNKDFTKLLAGQFFSNFGDGVLRISLLLYVFSFTGSIFLTTLILSIQIIPWIIVGPIAGVMADRISRKAIMIFSDLLRAISISLIILTENIYGLMIISFLVGVASSSFTAPRSAAIPEITGTKLYVKAISLSQLLFQTMAIIGPVAGAYIYVIFGKYTFIFISTLFIFSGIFIFFATIPSATNSAETLNLAIIISDLKQGISYLLKEPTINKLIILFGITIVGAAFSATLVYPFIFENLHDGSLDMESKAQKEYGLIGALIALGSIFGNLTFGKFENQIGRRFAIIIGSLGMGAYLMVFYFISSVSMLYVISIGYGFLSGLSSLAINAIFAETVPNEIRGRAYSATISYMMTFNAIATFGSGLLAEQYSIASAIIGCGIVIFILVILLSISTKFFAFDSVSDPDTASIGSLLDRQYQEWGTMSR